VSDDLVEIFKNPIESKNERENFNVEKRSKSEQRSQSKVDQAGEI